MARTSEEKAVDRLLTLYLINECYRTHNLRVLSETKLQKLVFLTEKELIDTRIKALNYRFVKLLHPTYSSELSSDLNHFVRMKYLTEPWFGRSAKMRLILEDFNEVFERNHHLLNIIDNVLMRYANIRTNRLVNLVFRMTWRVGRNRLCTIRDLKLRTPLLYPLIIEKAQEVFQITEDELEDLEICLNPKLSKDLDKAFNEMRRGKMLSHEEVFG